MKRRIVLAAALAALLGGSACTTPQIPMLYTAQNSVRGNEAIATGKFRYLPADQGRLQPNQIENTAMGKLLLDTDVATYMKRAFALELDRSGFSAAAPKAQLDCDVEQLKADDLGFSVDWYLSMSCRFEDLRNQSTAASATSKIVKLKTSKSSGLEILQRYINGLIVEAYEEVFSPALRQKLAQGGDH